MKINNAIDIILTLILLFSQLWLTAHGVYQIGEV